MGAMEPEEIAEGRYNSDIDAHEHAMSMRIGAVVQQSEDLLGPTAVAAIGGVRETRAVAQWMNGREPQRSHVLRFALQIATMISTPSDREVARAWFSGSNPYLNDVSPLTLLRDNPLDEIQFSLLVAARAFALRKEHDPARCAPVGDATP